MHLLAAQPGRIDDGEGAVDLRQTPAEILFLSAADTDLAIVAAASRDWDGPSLRLANLLQLNHPMSVDLYLDRMIPQAKLIIVRLLGGYEYWPYGVDSLRAFCRAEGIKLVFLPGDNKWDDALAGLGTLEPEEQKHLLSYLAEGGQANARHFLDYAAILIGDDRAPKPAQPLPACGFYHSGRLTGDLETLLAGRQSERKLAYLVFYRALMLSGDTQPIDALIKALADRGIDIVAIFVPGLKDASAIRLIGESFATAPPDIILNATSFAAGSWHPDGGSESILNQADCPVLQVVFASMTAALWRESAQGLGPRDVAMHVALPEVDGRILTRAAAFKAEAYYDTKTECAIRALQPEATRIDFIADLAARWVELRLTSADDRRVAIMLAQYPHRLSRLANGVGLDTPESVVRFLRAMQADGYVTANLPEDGQALMTQITAMMQEKPITWALADYEAWYQTLPLTARDKIEARWGAPAHDPILRDGQFPLPVLMLGNVVIAIQPARGYGIDPVATYHDPDLPPPHSYLALYGWLRTRWKAHALIQFGKHGNLEWLPGKALALSESCFPEVALGSMPVLYPFIVNDPGEGSQAKRRSAAVVIDHLTPPLTRAELYGPLSSLEQKIDEYYQAATLDPRRCKILRDEILEMMRRLGLDRDLGIDKTEAADEALTKLDAHLCDLKELQIRDGLHIFGSEPSGQSLTDLIVALARLPRGDGEGPNESLLRAIARDLDLFSEDFDPLSVDFSKSWIGQRPNDLSLSSQWRHAGDVVESLEACAAALVSGSRALHPDWEQTRLVVQWIDDILHPCLRQSADDETGNLLRGLSGRFVPPGPSGAPTRGRPDVLPTGRNFFSIDPRAVPTPAAWTLGWKSASLLIERYRQDHGEWPRTMAISAWGTANMRTGGDDIAQALALMGVRPRWDDGGARVAGFEILPLSVLARPRVDVTFRISGFFRDAFPLQIDLIDSAVRAVASLDEPAAMNPLAARYRAELAMAAAKGESAAIAAQLAGSRVFGAKPGAYGAGMQALIDEGVWRDRSDFADAYLAWGGYAYGSAQEGDTARDWLAERLRHVQAVIHNQDNREHDVLDSDDYYQFEGGLAAAIATLSGREPTLYHNDHSRPEYPRIQRLEEEIAKIVRGRAANPKWIKAAMRHGYKGAFEMAATVDYLFAFAATARCVQDHHFDQLHDAYIADEAVYAFLSDVNPHALHDIAARLLEARDRGLWRPGRNDMPGRLLSIIEKGRHD